MKRTTFILCFVLFCFSTVSLCAQNFELDGSYPYDLYSGLDGFDIVGDTLIYDFEDDTKPNLSVKFKVVHIDGMTFLQFEEKMPAEASSSFDAGLINIETDDKILVLAGNRIGNSRFDEPFIIGATSGFHKYYPSTFPRFFEGRLRAYKDASSYLIEKDKSYPVENLCNLAVETPWVEDAPGYGIGESFVIVKKSNVFTTLLIMNGYISCEKPYLYKQNGRIKKIKVTGLESGKSGIVTVLDTPHPQTVDISFITEVEDLKIEIVDVYEGTKYEDTCIHFLITWNDKIIPYENEVEK